MKSNRERPVLLLVHGPQVLHKDMDFKWSPMNDRLHHFMPSMNEDQTVLQREDPRCIAKETPPLSTSPPPLLKFPSRNSLPTRETASPVAEVVRNNETSRLGRPLKTDRRSSPSVVKHIRPWACQMLVTDNKDYTVDDSMYEPTSVTNTPSPTARGRRAWNFRPGAVTDRRNLIRYLPDLPGPLGGATFDPTFSCMIMNHNGGPKSWKSSLPFKVSPKLPLSMIRGQVYRQGEAGYLHFDQMALPLNSGRAYRENGSQALKVYGESREKRDTHILPLQKPQTPTQLSSGRALHDGSLEHQVEAGASERSYPGTELMRASFFHKRSRFTRPPENIPQSDRDELYWRRRRKNNEAAKRSRDARRTREIETANRAARLEHENVQLKREIEELKQLNKQLRHTVTDRSNPDSENCSPDVVEIIE